jgi:TonB-linked SusC/RagA family outer membrane protein
MKLTTILLFAGLMQLHATGFSQSTFNLNENNISVKEMFKKIEKQSKYSIFYRQDQVNLTRKVNVTAENSDINSVMQQVLKDQPLSFELIDEMVVIKSSAAEAAMDFTVTGTITDEAGEPLPGANVSIKGTTSGTLTDVNGKFSLTVPGEGSVVLVVTYLGFGQQEITVSASQPSIAVRMTADASELDEVVVIGYGTVKKRDLTGSVSSVKAEDIMRTPTHNAVEALQGRATSVDITRNSGSAGASSNITVRGNKSPGQRTNVNNPNRQTIFQANAPLYILDGFQVSNIDAVNPNDIESIEILKDASSTAIYGALGANGVIIVTTKKGSAGKVKVNYDAFYGVNTYDFPKARTGEDYLKLRREAARTINITDDAVIFDGPGELTAIQNGQFIDWLDLVVQDGSQQSHNVSVNAGSDKTTVFASAGYFKEEGMLRGNDFNRYNLRLNVDQKLASWAKVGANTQVVYSRTNNRRSPLGQATQISPFGTVYDEDGVIKQYPLPDGTTISPLADERNDLVSRNNSLNTNIVANAYVEINPLKGLTFTSRLGTNLGYRRTGIFNDRTSLAQNNTGNSVASQETANSQFINWDNILTYNKVIGDHNLTLTGITSYIQSDSESLFASGQGQILGSQLYYDLNSTSSAITRSIDSDFTRWNNMAYALRANYSYKGKYLLSLSGRRDAASRLSPDKRVDFFPAVAVGWNVFEESFIKDIKQISNLKLRASYGTSGNYNIDPYGTQSLLQSGSNMSFGDIPANYYRFGGRIGNAGLGWEKTTGLNIGLDVGVFNNRINATIDWSDVTTSDILLLRSLPFSTGVEDVYENIGETKNKTIELTLNTQNIIKGDFKWSSTLTFTRNREKISKLIDERDILPNNAPERNALLLGHPITSFYTYEKLGIWQESEALEAANLRVNSATGYAFQPGDIKLRDVNGDGFITAADMKFIGSTVPDWFAGLQNNFSYKGFDLGVFLMFRYGQTIDADFLGRYNTGGTGNGPEIINYWTPENPTNDFPRPRRGTTLANYAGYTGYQALSFVDGSFFKIKNVSLGYTLPKNKSGNSIYDRIRIYATANNLLTVAKSQLIKNYDPERGGSEDSPLSRSFVFGLNVGF